VHSVAEPARLAELQNIYATAPVGLCCVDTGLRYISINDRLASYNGAPAEAHIGRTLREMIPDVADAIEPVYRHVLQTSEPVFDQELVGRTAAAPAVERTWTCTYSPVRDPHGQVIAVNTVVVDVTDRKAHERELQAVNDSLRQRDEFLHVVGDKLPRAMFFRVVHDFDGTFRFTYVSEGVEAVTGLKAEALLSRSAALGEIIVADDRPMFFDAMARSLQSLSPFDEVCRLQWPDGSLHWSHFRAGHRVDLDGRVICEGIALNTTSHKRAEEALLESEARNRAIMSALPDMMFLLSTDGQYLDVHARDEHQLLVPPSTFIGKTISEVLPPDLARQISQCFDRVLADGSAVTDYALTVNGERRHYEARMVPCGPDKILSIVRDVTESKRAQHEVQHSRLELAHISRVTVLGEITASIAHELNQPLTAILSNAQAAKHAIAGGRLNLHDISDMLSDIIAADQRAGEVIRRLRTWLSRDQFLPQPLDLNQVILDVEHLIRSELIMRHVRLTLKLESGLPEVAADRVQIQQVILNLALNGIEAMEDSAAADRHLVIETSAAGRGVQCAVRDRGTGIEPGHMDRLFDAFFSTKPTGLGIGLRICSSIISAHGGRIWAVNNDDGGATFFFTLTDGEDE
jgi:PAS domain S-box-containing protein